MKVQRLTTRLAGLLIAACVAWGGAAQADPFLLTGNSGGELQIGTGLPLPIGPNGIFTGGMTVGDAANFPDLLVPPNDALSTANPNPSLVIQQDLATGNGGAIQFPPAALSRPAPGSPVPIAVFPTNNAVFQVATSIDYAWPNAVATLAPGSGPGNGFVATLPAVPGAVISYSLGNAFGGPAQFSIAPGSGAAGGRVPPNSNGDLPVASVWINVAGAAFVSTAMAAAVVGAGNDAGVGQPGAPIAAPGVTSMFGPLDPADGPFGFLNVGTVTVGPSGTINNSIPGSALPTPMGGTIPPLSNGVITSKGFPWTTGRITIAQTQITPPETFFLEGTDMRVSGVGNIQLVSGALSDRILSGPNANRGWLSLTLATPEPTAALLATGALGMLVVAHGAVRRRSR